MGVSVGKRYNPQCQDQEKGEIFERPFKIKQKGAHRGERTWRKRLVKNV